MGWEIFFVPTLLIHYFQKYFPQDHITLFVDQRNSPLVPYLTPVNNVVIFSNAGNKYLNFFQLARKHAGIFDMAISAKTSPMKLMNFFLFCLQAKESYAYVSKAWHKFFVNTPFIFDQAKAESTHQAIKSIQLIHPEMQTIPEEFFPTARVPEALKKEEAPPFHLNGPLLLLSATTTRVTSRLDETRYANIVNRLYEKYPFSAVIVGQEPDLERSNFIAKGLKCPHVIYFPRNFAAFMVLLDLCDFYFVGDGGVAHIGAALKKKLVVLFGETNPTEWSPLSSDPVCFYHPSHVNFLSDNEIFAALDKKLGESICGRNSL